MGANEGQSVSWQRRRGRRASHKRRGARRLRRKSPVAWTAEDCEERRCHRLTVLRSPIPRKSRGRPECRFRSRPPCPENAEISPVPSVDVRRGHVSKSLSRWRHGFESRWGYCGESLWLWGFRLLGIRNGLTQIPRKSRGSSRDPLFALPNSRPKPAILRTDVPPPCRAATLSRRRPADRRPSSVVGALPRGLAAAAAGCACMRGARVDSLR